MALEHLIFRDRVASRCDDDYAQLMCENMEISSLEEPADVNLAIGSLPEIDLSDLEETDDVIAELEDLEDTQDDS